MIYVVKSIFNSDITNGLYDGFQEAINEDGYDKEIKLIVVPGAFDIPELFLLLLTMKTVK